MRRIWAFLLLAFLSVPLAYVVWQAVLTLRALDQIEAERDTWQRPDAVVAALDLHPGQTVVDFGSGAGYFALKLAPVVGPDGAVLATDVRRESLTFLWMRAHLKGVRQPSRHPRRSTRPAPTGDTGRCRPDLEYVP